MLPMGTIMTSCMFIGVVYAGAIKPFIGYQKPLSLLDKAVGWLLLLTGSWNVLWYASQNIIYFWGQMALLSGLLMWALSAILLQWKKLPDWVNRAKPLVILALAASCFKYGYTIYQL